MALSNKSVGKPLYHTAVYGGRQYTQTATQWMHILNTTQSAIQRGLNKYNSMQHLIDVEYADAANKIILWRRFCFGI